MDARVQRTVLLPVELDDWLRARRGDGQESGGNALIVDAVRLFRELHGGGASPVSVRLLDGALAALDELPACPTARPATVRSRPSRLADPVGLKEMSARSGTHHSGVRVWMAQRGFPRPRWVVSGRPAWDWPDVAAWLARTGRTPKVAQVARDEQIGEHDGR